eukprot:g83309.t1
MPLDLEGLDVTRREPCNFCADAGREGEQVYFFKHGYPRLRCTNDECGIGEPGFKNVHVGKAGGVGGDTWPVGFPFT